MKVYRDINDVVLQGPVVVTQGTFDGVHYGHQKILSEVVSTARTLKGESVLLTYYPHPRLVLYPNDNDLKLLNTLDEKEHLVRDLGIDHLVVLPFTKEFSRMSPEEFVKDILIDKLKVTKLVIGYDHRFGKNRSGSLEDMERFGKKFGFEVQEIPAQDIENSIVSSTKVRNALLRGDVKEANELLGREYSVHGIVVHGTKRGHSLGYPTANVQVSSEYKLIPANGVYAVKVKIKDELFGGMLNIGDNPTFLDKNWSVEVHIFDFNKDIYNAELEISFIERMRDEIKFSNIEKLMEQMKTDERNAKQILG